MIHQMVLHLPWWLACLHVTFNFLLTHIHSSHCCHHIYNLFKYTVHNQTPLQFVVVLCKKVITYVDKCVTLNDKILCCFLLSYLSLFSLLPDWWRIVISQGGVLVSHSSDQLWSAWLPGWWRRSILPCKWFLFQSHGILCLFTGWESFGRGNKEVSFFF